MKITVTGHTQGIGAACYDLLGKDHRVQGFSRSNGFELPGAIDQVVKASRCSDVFIINADPHSQLDLFERVYSEWQNHRKHIVVIGSRASYLDPSYNDYFRTKNQLRDRVHWFQLNDTRAVKITQVHPGFVNCGVVAGRTDVPMLETSQVAEAIAWCIGRPYEVAELAMWQNDK